MAPLDTSGIVKGPFNCTGYADWDDLTLFAQGYVEALFSDGVSLTNGAMIPRVPLGFSDIAPETLARIMKDCERALTTQLWGNSAVDGRLFWSERTEELFSGFWGGQQTLLCEDLFPPLTPYLGGDGKVYLRATAAPPVQQALLSGTEPLGECEAPPNPPASQQGQGE